MKPRGDSEKQAILITDERLADIVRTLLLNPDAAGEDMSPSAHGGLRRAIAEVVADHCGGDVEVKAEGIEVTPNDSSPEGGGVWAALIPHALPTKAVAAIERVLNSIDRDDEGGYITGQAAVVGLNQLSALVGRGPWLIDGKPEHGLEIQEFPRAEWDENCEYHEFVDRRLREEYEATAREFATTDPAQSTPEPGI